MPFRYDKQCLSFFQLSMPGSLTLVVQNDTAVWISGLALRHRNKTAQWCGESGLQSPLIAIPSQHLSLPRTNDPREESSCAPFSSSGHSLSTSCRYSIMEIINAPEIDQKIKSRVTQSNTLFRLTLIISQFRFASSLAKYVTRLCYTVTLLDCQCAIKQCIGHILHPCLPHTGHRG